MAWVATAVVAGSVITGAMGADAAGNASDAQAASSADSIAEQRRQFDAMRALLAPYVTQGTTALGGLAPYAAAGAPALQQQQALAGLSGTAAQQSAISGIESSPMFAATMQQGENALRQNASATGGLRGGNLQAALAQFRPQVLSQLIDQQYSRLGGLTSLGQQTTQNLATMGQASAAGTGTAGMQSAANIAGLQQQQGAAQAGGIIGQANAWGSAINAIPQGLGMYYGMTGQSPFGGGGSTQAAAPIVDQSIYRAF